jgi:nucleotidyltransferase/DNA polymerase involved in DNA repair
MGVPWFRLKDAQFPEKLHVFSSNYELYASMSARVMTHLEELAPRVEQYSIDEMFLDIRASTAALTLKTSAGSCVSMLVTVRDSPSVSAWAPPKRWRSQPSGLQKNGHNLAAFWP